MVTPAPAPHAMVMATRRAKSFRIVASNICFSGWPVLFIGQPGRQQQFKSPRARQILTERTAWASLCKGGIDFGLERDENCLERRAPPKAPKQPRSNRSAGAFQHDMPRPTAGSQLSMQAARSRPSARRAGQGALGREDPLNAWEGLSQGTSGENRKSIWLNQRAIGRNSPNDHIGAHRYPLTYVAYPSCQAQPGESCQVDISCSSSALMRSRRKTPPAEAKSLTPALISRQVHAAVEGQDNKLIEITLEQWRFLRGVYAMNAEAPPGLPCGDDVVLAQRADGSDDLLFFVDGDKLGAPMHAPPVLLSLIEQQRWPT